MKRKFYSALVEWWTVCSWAWVCDIWGASRERMLWKQLGWPGKPQWGLDDPHLLCSLAVWNPQHSPRVCLFTAVLSFCSQPQRLLRKRMTNPSACPGHPTPASRSHSWSFFPSCSLSGSLYLMSENLWVNLCLNSSLGENKTSMVATIVYFQLCCVKRWGDASVSLVIHGWNFSHNDCSVASHRESPKKLGV